MALLLTALARHAAGAPLTDDEIATIQQVDRVNASSYPTDEATRLVYFIGQSKDMDRIRFVLDLKRRDLTNILCGIFEILEPSIPVSLETMFVERYDEPEYRQLLRCTIGKRIDNDGTRAPRHRTRALFDRYYDELLKDRGGTGVYLEIVATDLPGIEPAFVDALPKLGAHALAELVRVLARRKYVPAVPALVALQKNPPRSPGDRDVVLSAVNAALTRIGTPEAVDAVLERLKAMRPRGNERAMEQEMLATLGAFANVPANVPPDYEALRGALPDEPTLNLQIALAEVAGARKGATVGELIRSLDVLNRTNVQAVETIVLKGTDDDLRAARARIERWRTFEKPPAEYYIESLLRRLGAGLAPPTAVGPKRATPAREKEVVDQVSAYALQLGAAHSLRDKDAARHARELELVLERAEVLAAQYADVPQAASLRPGLAEEFSQLAEFVRSALREPQRAVALYRRAIRLAEGEACSPALAWPQRLSIADTYRFDLRDAPRVLDAYAELSRCIAGRQTSASRSPNDAAIDRALTEQIDAEVAFLRDGKRYRGKPGLEAISKEGFLLVIASGSPMPNDPDLAKALRPLRARTPTDGERRNLAGLLEALPASQRYVLLSFGLLPVLETPERIDAFLRKHDPTGYQTAVSFAALPVIDKSLASSSSRPSAGLGLRNWTESDRALMKRAEALSLQP